MYRHCSETIQQTGRLPAEAGQEADQVFANLVAILSAAGAGLSDVVRVGIFMRDLQRDRPAFNQARGAAISVTTGPPDPQSR